MRWNFVGSREEDCPATLPLWAEKLEISFDLAKFLWGRGLRNLREMELFLNPSLKHLAPLGAWPGLLESAEALSRGILGGKRLCVWGDYDVDGITATALVVDFLARHGVACLHHIPGRLTEGYGLNKESIAMLADNGVEMLLTVDSGISDIEPVAHAKALGMTVIISDHHLPGDALPPADAIVNPRLAPCPCPALAGVGVAFFLMAAVNVALARAGRPKIDIRPLLDLVALGTLADVVDLNGQNRILVKNGLLKIAEGSRVGIAALKTACNFSPSASLGAGQVVFSLAPRLNAAGRLGSSEAALELLLTTDRARALVLANELSRLNAERREEEDRILAEAMAQAEEQAQKGLMGLVLYSPDWHPGIIGIVASRVVEALGRPTVVLSSTDSGLKGSGRSVPGLNMFEAFSHSSDLLLGFGGHRMAAGLNLAMGILPLFRERFNTLAAEALGLDPPEGECRLDGELPFSNLDFSLLKELEMLQPFGSGNAEPLFASPPVRVRNMRGRPGFMLLDLLEEESGICLKAKAWRSAAEIPQSVKNSRIRIAYTPRIDRYNGVASVDLRIKDWKRDTNA